MSTAPVVLVAGTGAAAATHTTASFSPAADRRLVAYIASFKATVGVATPTISDTGGLTWTLLASYVMSTFSNPDTRGDWYISSDTGGGTPAARTVTVTSTGAASIGVMVASVLTSDVSGSIVQFATGEDLSAGDPQITFGSAPGATNIVLLGTSHVGGSTVTGPTGYTSLCNSVHSASRKIACAYDITSASQSPQYTSLNARVIMLGIELAPPSAGAVNVNATTNSATITCGDVTVTANQTVSVDAATNLATVSVGDVTVTAGAGAVNVSVDATGNSVTATLGDESIVGKANTDAATNLATVSAGDVTVTGKASVDATGNQATISVGNVTVSTVSAVNVSVNATGNSLAIGTQTATVVGKASVSATTNLLTVTAGSVSFPVPVSVNVTGEFLGVGQGTVTVTAGGALTGNAATISVGTATVTAVTTVTVSAMTALTASSGRGTVRLVFGNPLGPTLVANLASITNPFVAVNVAVDVQAGDLIYAVLSEQTNITVTAMSDNLGNTYTALSAGSDCGASTSRAFYAPVTVAGMLTQVSAACTSSGDNAVMLAQAFQGPFTTPSLDANPGNAVNADIVSPYVGPSTGTLTQADELLVAWLTRPDSTGIVPVAPLLVLAQFNSGTVIRTALSYRVLASTSSVAPSWTSATDPTQTIMGATSFKKSTGGGLNVNVDATGSSVTASVGTATVTAVQNVTTNAATNLATVSAGTVTIVGKARALADTNLLTTAIGDETVTGTANVTTASTGLTISLGNVTVGEVTGVSVDIVASPALAISAGTVSVTQGFGVSVSTSMTFSLISIGNETVQYGAGASPAAMPELTMPVAGTLAVNTKVNYTVFNVPQMTIAAGMVTVVGTANTTIAAVPGMTISGGDETIGLGVQVTVTAMPALVASTALADGVTITGSASIMVTGNQMNLQLGNVFVSISGGGVVAETRGEGQMLVMSRLMGN